MLKLLFEPFYTLLQHKAVIKQFVERNIKGRYRGSYLGIFWSFLTPLFMLAVYTFVFSVVFEARWGTNSGNKIEFALVLFCGLIVYNIFSEVLVGSTSIILNNVNLVKKVVFPLEIFPLVLLGTSLFHGAVSIIILTSGILLFMGSFHWTILFVPLVLLPVCFISLGIGWFLASLGVYIRDISQVMGILVTALMFLSPIFYPVTSVPEEIQLFFYFNPISYAVEDLRSIIIWGEYPNWTWLLIGSLIGIVIMYLGYLWFRKTRKGFADVI
jgi:lipopolysaccharide transport system permease protein